MTVRDILTFGGLRSAVVVAGKEGLDRPVESVTVLEIAEAAISTWAIKNQLFITSFYAIANNVQMQKIVIQALHESCCCGLVICHIKYVLLKIDESVLDLCNELRFPLIVADTDTSFVDIINPILSEVSNLEAEDKKVDSLQLRSDFFNLLTSERPVSEILQAFAYKMKYEISFMDIHFNCLYSNKSEKEKQAEHEYLDQNIHWSELDINHASYHVACFAGSRNMIYFIKKNGVLFGFLCIKYRQNDTDAQVLQVADSLNIPCALLLNKTRKLHNTMYEYQQTFFSDLLVWNFPSVEAALRRAEELGYRLPDKHYAVVININSLQNGNINEQETRGYINQWLMPAINSTVKAYAAANIIYFRSDVIILLLEHPSEESQVRALAEKLLTLLPSSKIGSVSIGISRRFGAVTDIPQAYTEAFHMAIMGRSLLGVNHIADFSSMGMLFYIRSMRNDPKIMELCQKIIAPLKMHDETKGTELVKTAYVLLLNNLDSQICADALHVHRNTLLYRKNQIHDLLGYDPFVQPHAFHLFAACFLLGLTFPKP